MPVRTLLKSHSSVIISAMSTAMKELLQPTIHTSCNERVATTYYSHQFQWKSCYNPPFTPVAMKELLQPTIHTSFNERVATTHHSHSCNERVATTYYSHQLQWKSCYNPLFAPVAMTELLQPIIHTSCTHLFSSANSKMRTKARGAIPG